jgi:hypothetical protein
MVISAINLTKISLYQELLRFHVLMTKSMKLTAFWGVAFYSLVEIDCVCPSIHLFSCISFYLIFCLLSILNIPFVSLFILYLFFVVFCDVNCESSVSPDKDCFFLPCQTGIHISQCSRIYLFFFLYIPFILFQFLSCPHSTYSILCLSSSIPLHRLWALPFSDWFPCAVLPHLSFPLPTQWSIQTSSLSIHILYLDLLFRMQFTDCPDNVGILHLWSVS